jgi:hypothetical protein
MTRGLGEIFNEGGPVGRDNILLGHETPPCGHRVLLDFGTTWVKAGHAMNRIDYLLQSYAPTVIVLEERMRKGSRHRVKANHLIWQILRSAVTHKVRVKWISRSDIKRAIAPARNRHERACAIARLYPELVSYLPPQSYRRLKLASRSRIIITASTYDPQAALYGKRAAFPITTVLNSRNGTGRPKR